jgi:Icc protein
VNQTVDSFVSRVESKAILRFVHVSDTHIHHDPTYVLQNAPHPPNACARALVNALNALPFQPDFVLHTGDVAYNPDPKAYTTAREIFSEIRYPIHYLSGNHDDKVSLQRVLLEREVPLIPFDFEFEMKSVHVVCFDSHGTGSEPAGFLNNSQLTRLESICSASDERPLIVAVHHNVLKTGIPWWDDVMCMANGDAFHEALLPARHRLRGVFHGHVHQPVDTLRHGILYSGVAAAWYQLHTWPGQTDAVGDTAGQPGFNVVTVTPKQTFIRRHLFRVGN